MKTNQKILITTSIIAILFFFPSPQTNFMVYLPILLISIFALVKLWTKKK